MNEDSLSVRGGQTPFEGLSIRGAAQWSQDTAVAYIAAAGAATELMLLRQS